MSLSVLFGKVLLPPDPPSYKDTLNKLFFVIPENNKSTKIPTLYTEWIGTNGETAFFTVIFSGSHDEDLGKIINDIELLKTVLHANIVAFDYCGFGLHETKDKITEKTFNLCLETIVNWVIKTKGIPHERIILMGKGVGTGPVVSVASDQKKKKVSFGALILLSPMGSLASILPPNSPFEKLAKETFNNIKLIKNVQCPILIAHGDKDAMIPIENSKKLFKQCAEGSAKLLELEEVGHYGVYCHDDFLEAAFSLMKVLAPHHEAHNVSLVPKTVPVRYVGPEENIKNWLKPIDMTHYTNNFLMNGFYKLDNSQLSLLDHTELDIMGITDKADQEKILQYVSNILLMNPIKPYLISWGELDLENRVVLRWTTDVYTFATFLKGQKVVVTQYLNFNDKHSFVKQAVRLLEADHPNVLNPTYAVLEQQLVALIFPWCEGQSLENVVYNRCDIAPTSLSDTIKFELAKKLADGLRYLSERLEPPFFHKRLDSSLIRLKVTDNGINPKLLGLSQLSFTNPRPHLPPELKISSPDQSSMVYSFGVILCELAICAQKPFTAEILCDYIQRVQSLPRFSSKFLSDTPPTITPINSPPISPRHDDTRLAPSHPPPSYPPPSLPPNVSPLQFSPTHEQPTNASPKTPTKHSRPTSPTHSPRLPEAVRHSPRSPTTTQPRSPRSPRSLSHTTKTPRSLSQKPSNSLLKDSDEKNDRKKRRPADVKTKRKTTKAGKEADVKGISWFSHKQALKSTPTSPPRMTQPLTARPTHPVHSPKPFHRTSSAQDVFDSQEYEEADFPTEEHDPEDDEEEETDKNTSLEKSESIVFGRLVEPLIAACLQTDPKERPTFNDVIAQLDGMMYEMSIIATHEEQLRKREKQADEGDSEEKFNDSKGSLKEDKSRPLDGNERQSRMSKTRATSKSLVDVKSLIDPKPLETRTESDRGIKSIAASSTSNRTNSKKSRKNSTKNPPLNLRKQTNPKLKAKFDSIEVVDYKSDEEKTKKEK